MMKTVACITVRMSSTRLPLKALRDILPGVTMLDFLIHRIKESRLVNGIYICTSTEPLDDILEDVAARNDVRIYRGSLENVVERLQGVRKIEQPDYLIRLTGDNPFIDAILLDKQIEMAIEESLDYVRLTDVPLGATGEVIKSEVIDTLENFMSPDVSEYLMLYLFDPDHFKCGMIKPFTEDYSDLWATVDTSEDLRKARHLATALRDVQDFSLKRLVSELKCLKEPGSAGDSMIKLPRGETMTYSDFQRMMEFRKSKALTREIHSIDPPSK